MPGTDVPAEAGGDFVGRSGGEAWQTFSSSNSFRVSSVMDNLALQMQPGLLYDPVKFSQLCLALARGINYAIVNNEVLATVQHWAIMLKQICQHRNNDDVRTAIMVLMLSVKNACQLGWFSDEDNEEFLAIAAEIGRSYGNIRDINVSNRNPLPPLSDIMTKFFPLVKLGQILTSVEMKEVEYEALVHDFVITKKMVHSPGERIMLFVAQIDIAHTSACIISPQQVDFSLNGRGVDKRNNIAMDSGPQMPTDVTRMLKYGINLLQAIGQFNGHYLIVIAFMSFKSSPDATAILDHVQPAVSGNDSDLDMTVGPSRISLNCPISYTRIKTPVKGQSCKHLQCFDFHNFVDINSRRPSWRCPHCNQSVCYSDIRIDQNIFKILREVGNNVSEVIISAEGSWKAVLENDDNMNSYKDENCNILEDVAESDCSLPKFVDLTDDDYKMDSTPHEDEDKKPSHASLNIPSVPVGSNFPLDGNGNVSQSVPAEMDDEFWSRILNSSPFTSTSVPEVQAVGHMESNPATHLMPPSTNTLLPAFNGSSGNPGYFNYASASMHSQISSHNNVQIQDSYPSILSPNEYGSVPPMQSHPSRAPVAVQALPVQLPTTGQQHRSRNYLNSLNVNNSSAPSSITPARDDTVRRNSERLPHLSRHHVYPHQAPNRPTVGAGGMRLPSTVQNQVRDRRHLPSSTPLPCPAIVRSSFPRDLPPLPSLAPAVVQSSLPRSTNRPSPALTHFQNEHLQRALNSSITQNIRLPNSSQPQFRQIPAQLAAPVARHSVVQTPSPPTVAPFQPRFDRSNLRGRAHPTSSTTDSLTLDVPSDQDWQPTGQMRGSLSGRAYSAALDKLIIRPTQHEPSRPGLAANNTTSYVDPTPRV